MTYSGLGAKIANSATGIRADSSAMKVGLRVGDIIINFDGKTINSPDELIVAVRAKNIGDRVKLTYLRDKISHDVIVTLVASR